MRTLRTQTDRTYSKELSLVKIPVNKVPHFVVAGFITLDLVKRYIEEKFGDQYQLSFNEKGELWSGTRERRVTVKVVPIDVFENEDI